MQARPPSCAAKAKACCPSAWWPCRGQFARGDVIAICEEGGAGNDKENGPELARGLANYSDAEARLLCRKPSAEIAAVLGYAAEPEMVHRDNLVLLD